MTTSQPSSTMEEKATKDKKSVYKETTTKRQPRSVFGRNNKRLFLSMAVVSRVVLSAFVCLFVCTYLSICPYAPFPYQTFMQNSRDVKYTAGLSRNNDSPLFRTQAWCPPPERSAPAGYCQLAFQSSPACSHRGLWQATIIHDRLKAIQNSAWVSLHSTFF